MTFPEMQRQSNFWPISHLGITLNVNRAKDGHKLRRRYKLAVIRFSGCDPPQHAEPFGKDRTVTSKLVRKTWGDDAALEKRKLGRQAARPMRKF